MSKIVVIGGGQAAASTIQKFREFDQTSPVTLICEERHPPYQRPPLSKKYLAGEMEAERLFFKPMSWYDENDVDVKLSTKALKLDRAAQSVTLENGETIPYDQLALTMGARPKTLPASVTHNAKNVYAIRALDDIDAMLNEFQKGRKLLIIGGGYIGLEAAAIARKFEVNVTLVEAAPRILGRVASEITAGLIRNIHLENDVQILEGQTVQDFTFAGDRINGARLQNGETLEVDFVIIGIGIAPNQELADEAGVTCDDGILVDEYGRSSDAHIFAAGDCTRFMHDGALIRIESVGHAIDQGHVVGANLAGQNITYTPKPWFWSDQYEANLQIAGLNTGYDDVVLRGDGESRSVSVWYYKNDKLIAVDALNDPRAYMIAKRVIEAGKSIPKEAASDLDTNLKTFL